MLMQALLNGDQAMMRALAKQAVQRFAGMEPGRPGRRHVLPVPHAAEPRSRRHARQADGADRQEQVGGELTPLEERLEQRRVRAPHRAVQEGDRGRDPSPPRGRPWRRGDGQDAAQAAARRRRVHARLARRDAVPEEGAVSAHPQARRPPGPQAPARPQGPARLPQHGAPLAQLRRRAGRAEVQVPAAGQARADGRRRHLRVGRRVRPLHADARVRDPGPVLEGPLVRVHRRHRRGHRLLQGDRGHPGGDPPGQHRGRRGVGRRPLRLRPRVRGVLGALRQGRRPEDHGAAARRRPQQLPREPELGGQGDPAQGAPRVLAEPRAASATGTPATRSSASTAPTPTASTSAATCASSRPSSRSSS